MEKPLNFVLTGRSGCGKGTQAKLLMEHFGRDKFFYISTGDLFRDLANRETDTAIKIKKVLKEGGLPFDVLATTLWMHEMAFKMKENQGLMADGFPRRLDEAKNLDSFLDFLGRREKTFYILIDISRKEAFNRLTKRRLCLKCGRIIPYFGDFIKLKKCDECQGELATRPDDKPEAIENRLNYYEERVVPIIDYWRDKGELIIINGEQSIEDTHKDILKAIAE
jgi:adenylate kinase